MSHTIGTIENYFTTSPYIPPPSAISENDHVTASWDRKYCRSVICKRNFFATKSQYNIKNCTPLYGPKMTKHLYSINGWLEMSMEKSNSVNSIGTVLLRVLSWEENIGEIFGEHCQENFPNENNTIGKIII